MTFLHPIFLWASLAVLIPIIVHLFNFRRPKRVAFPDISMIKEVKKSVVKRLRLRQWLLLAARCLAILALVFVFAGPVWRKNPETVAKGHSSVVVLLDNSYSMRAGNDKGEYWVQAQALAREIIEAHSRSDEFLVMSSHAPRTHYNFGEQQTAIKDLKGLSIHQNTRSLSEVVAAAGDIFANASDGVSKFSEDRWDLSGPLPHLASGAASIACSLQAIHPAGSHDLFIGEVRDVRLGPQSRPMVWFESAAVPLSQ